MDEASKLIAQIPSILTNPLPHNQDMYPSASNIENRSGGIQNHLDHDGLHGCVNMVQDKFNVSTRFRDYTPS